MKTNRKPYQVLDLVQGSDEWKQERRNYVTASQAPSLFNLSPYQKREALIVEKLTGVEAEVNEYKQVLFNQAHIAEKKCREWIEKEYSLEFKPAVLISNKCPDLLASLDGFNEENKIIFEAKYMGVPSLEDVRIGKIKPHHMVQMQAQLLASGAEKCIYFALNHQGEAVFHEIRPDKFYQLFISKYVTEFMDEVRTLKRKAQ